MDIVYGAVDRKNFATKNPAVIWAEYLNFARVGDKLSQ